MAAVDHYLAPLREHPRAVIATISVLLAVLLTFLMVIIFKMRNGDKTKVDCKTTLLTLQGPGFLGDVTLLTGDTDTAIRPLLNSELGQAAQSTTNPTTHETTDTWTLPKLSDDTFGTEGSPAAVKWTDAKHAGLTHGTQTNTLNTGSRPGTSDGSATITIRTGSTFAFWVATDYPDDVTAPSMVQGFSQMMAKEQSPGRLAALQIVRTERAGDALGARKPNLQANLLDLPQSDITWYYLVYGTLQQNQPRSPPTSDVDAIVQMLAETIATDQTSANDRIVFYDVSAKYMDGTDFVIPLTASCTT